MKFKILIPVYNDWKSVEKLLENINYYIKNLVHEISVIIVNDASNHDRQNQEKKLENIHSVKILNMKINQGHARCIAFGLRYLTTNNEIFDHVIIMDSDGEDRPEELKELIQKSLQNPDRSVVAKRVKRSEGIFFKFLYQAHKLLTLISTGKNINFGNYSCLLKKDVSKISIEKSLWSSFSGSLKFHLRNLVSIQSIRGVRYFGPSKMSLYNLIIHSFSIIGVFKYTVLLRSILICIVLLYFKSLLEIFFFILVILIIFFNLIIICVSLRENKGSLLKSEENLSNIDIIND